MDEVRVTRLRPPDRLPARAVTVAAILVVLAIVKPWGSSPPPQPAVERPIVAPVERVQSGAPAPRSRDEAILEHCFDPRGWRVFAHERWQRATIRSWKSVVPVATARGPRDPSIPVVLVATSRLPGLGYCAPAHGSERPPDEAVLTVWRIEPDQRAWQVPARLLLPVRPTVLGGLYAPSARGNGSWAPGRFVFAVRAAGYERWWAVEVVIDAPEGDPSGPGTSPSP